MNGESPNTLKAGENSLTGVIFRVRRETPERLASLLRASFRPRLTATPLRFANPSPPSGWAGDFHPQAIEHARHKDKTPPSTLMCGATETAPQKPGRSPMDENRIRGLRCRASGRMTGKPISIKRLALLGSSAPPRQRAPGPEQLPRDSRTWCSHSVRPLLLIESKYPSTYNDE